MPSINRKEEITTEEAIRLLREALEQKPVEPHSEFKRGDAVVLDTGDLGVVHSVDEESTAVLYLCDGEICGPAYGYELTPLEGF